MPSAAVCWHHQGFHVIRWCSLTCCNTPNLIIFPNKYTITPTVWVLRVKTCVLVPLPGSPWTFWGKRIKFWKERSLSLLLNYKFPYYSKLFDAEIRELQMIKRPAIFLDFATSPFFRWCRGLKCLTEWGRRRSICSLIKYTVLMILRRTPQPSAYVGAWALTCQRRIC